MFSDEDRRIIIGRFERLEDPVTIINFTQRLECQFCQPTEELLTELAALSDRIQLKIHNFVEDKELAETYRIDKIPATVILGEKDFGVRFFGIPSGYEFSSLIDAIVDVSRKRTDLSDDTREKLSGLNRPVHIQVFVTPTCPYCQMAVRLGHQLAIESDWITADMVEVTEFPHLGQKYQVMAVPKIVINDRISFEGALPEDQFVAKVIEASG
ncbi:glutaredoxin [candidate division WOR-3 bacterium]|uniref:Glutaredoxin n=1 Tax=candidate division WOR-3 bacterium TaxID=2052148 RepID=A0A660SKD2_UNCW3|nr:MAG: glutaredoxin [candidate division WOR-3 bacterium]